MNKPFVYNYLNHSMEDSAGRTVARFESCRITTLEAERIVDTLNRAEVAETEQAELELAN